MNGLIHWRRYRTRGLVRLWNKDFTLIGQLRTTEAVEPWWRWARRVAAEIAAVIRRREHRRPTYNITITGGPDTGRAVRSG